MRCNKWRKIPALLCTAALLLTGIMTAKPVYGAVPTASKTTVQTPEELRGVWISYLEWNKLPKDEAGFKKAVDAMFDECVSWGMNAVFVHVRSHGDAMYPSAYYPWSKFASGTPGKALSYDPLSYMVGAAHKRGLQFHAWFNPYRITGYLMSWDEVAGQSPAKRWLSDGDSDNDRWVLKHDGAYYYNPSAKAVKDLVIQGVMEVVNNYDVDGVHFDDYFYPELDDHAESRWFDQPEYVQSGQKLPIAQWRRNQVSELVYGVNQAVKASKPNVLFGVSPQGYVTHLRSDSKLFVDVDRWMSQDGFVDYIMPQLYWGFETKTSAGSPAPYAFDSNLNTWIGLKERGKTDLYLGLGMYRAGTDVKDYNEVSEWLRKDDIIKRQVETGRASDQIAGYCFFSYSSFKEAAAAKEVANLLSIFR